MRNKENWETAGTIARQALEYGQSLIKPGGKLLDVAEAIEQYIEAHGATPAFPVNISINNIAAHYSPFVGDDSVFKSSDVIKLDTGVVYKSCIGDTALTVDLGGKYSKLKSAVEDALAAAIEVAKPGVKTRFIGQAIDSTLKSAGFKPIKNLGGHQMTENRLHSGFFIPNYDDGSEGELTRGQILAIEPFAASKSFFIREKGDPYILMLKQPDAIYENGFSSDFINAIEPYKHLPFSLRWLNRRIDISLWLPAIKLLQQKKAFVIYEPLCSEKGDVVVQAEHTVLIDDRAIILTKT